MVGQFSIYHEKVGEELWDKIQYEPGGSLRHCLSSSSIFPFLLSSSARCTDIETGGSHILKIAIICRQSCESCYTRTIYMYICGGVHICKLAYGKVGSIFAYLSMGI